MGDWGFNLSFDERIGIVLQSNACGETVGFVVFFIEFGVVLVLELFLDVQLGDAAVEADELLGYLQPFGIVGVEYLGLQCSLQDQSKLPCEVVGIHHTDVEALSGFGALCVARVTHEKDSGSIMERVDTALSDAVLADPVETFDFSRVWCHDFLEACFQDLKQLRIVPFCLHQN